MNGIVALWEVYTFTVVFQQRLADLTILEWFGRTPQTLRAAQSTVTWRTGGAMSAEMSKLSVMTSAAAPAPERVSRAGCAAALRCDTATSMLSCGTCRSAASDACTPAR